MRERIQYESGEVGMKVRFIGESDPVMLLHGKIYDVISIEKGWYRIIDEEGVDEDMDVQRYLYPPDADLFEIVEE